MSDRLRLSVRLPHTHCVSSPDAVRAVAQLAEKVGFEAVSAQDHLLVDPAQHACHGGPSDNRAVYECFQTLAWAGAVTSRVKLLTSVVVITFRHPVVLAKEAATLDVFSNGRLILGVGVGALRKRTSDMGFKLAIHRSMAVREFDALDVKGNRGEIADEQLQVLDLLWTQEAPTFAGRHVKFDEFEMFPKPVQKPRPPIVVGGRSDAAVGRAARYADGWMPSHEKPDHFREGRLRALEAAQAAGRTLTTFGPNIDIAVDRDDSRARRLMEEAYGHHYETADDMWKANLAGSPERVLDQMRQWRESGANLMDLKIVPRSPVEATLEQLQLIGEEIIPELERMG